MSEMRVLLSEALDLCVRARNLDQMPARTKSGTPALWVTEQYEADLAAWMTRAKDYLSQGTGPTQGDMRGG